MTALAPITPADLAAILSTDARTTRKFLRSITPAEDRPGKGARWEIKATKANLTALAKKFTAFQEAQEAARDAREAARSAEVEEKVTPLDTPAETADDFDFDALEGPTDEELLEIDA